ncbi:lytic transglycosylase domain-containing protein [Variovorax terrae]|uniref:Lytic transglycosylase domain-containing protein n=1 Tax=Variovorax terrae TaxID=2923278 RepID=A0A9X2AQV2_9BURK|nr:lytic transglycosylase domain-containing protein [Variovorax terrae]MCJ0764872.1 lytic transglycosylase domain-containing protein [Variovorax terrae]
MQYTKILTPVLAALVASTLALPAPAQNRADELLLDMNQAYKRGDKKRLTQLLPQARGHALEPWAAYWELKARLDEAMPQEVHDFLTRYAGTYQEDRLRNDWLLLLGQRRDWAGFAAEHPSFRMGDDREVRCYALLIDFLKDGGTANPALADDVRRNWFALREADDGCTLAADRLISARKMPVADAWRKARLAIEANRPRAARNAVEIVAPESLNLVGELNGNPAKFLTGKAAASPKTRKELAVLALIKMATNDPDAAAGLLEDRWSSQLSAEERHWTWGVIGKQAATRLASDDALAYFAKVGKDGDLTDDMLAWKARAALRVGKWPQVLQAVNAMGDDARRDPTWVYWKARALQQHKSPAAAQEAQALLEGIAGPRGFYEQLALEELGQKITVPGRPQPLTPEEKEGARRNPGLNRGLYAILIGLRPEGVREWNYSTNLVNARGEPGNLNDRELLAAAQLACDNQVWDRCINTSERTKGEADYEQRFPMPFRDSVVKRSRDVALDPAYVYGLIRQESRFVMDARSGVGASGLMQVMPATARWTAKKLGMSGFSTDQLTDRDTNIAIGTGYLKLVLDDFAGSMALAAAAYNAGPGRPRSWRNGPVLDAAIWAENVPFSETRDYVKKVLSNTAIYAALLTGQPQSLKARLGTVGPRDASVPEPNKDIP